jgi:hypothetical protein
MNSGVLTGEQVLRRTGTAPALGLRAGGDDLLFVPQTATQKEISTMWLATLRNLVLAPRSSRPARQGCRAQLRLERLEDRALPSAYTAASVADLIADINAANTAGGSNTITLVAGTTFTLNAVDNTTDGATGLPVIAANDNLTITGNGDTLERSTASGTPAFRLLDVAGGGSLSLNNLTLQGGLAFGAGAWAEGGAIYNQGTLLLNSVPVQNNSAQGSPGQASSPGQSAAGGGIYSGGSLTLQGCTVQNNQALGGSALSYEAGADGGSGAGGGIYSGGALTLQGGTIQNNQAFGGQGGTYLDSFGGNGIGGGLYVAGGSASLSTVTLSANTAQGGDGADGVVDGSPEAGKHPPGFAAGNGGNGFGGGLYAAGGTVSLLNSTVNSNVAQGGDGGKGVNGSAAGQPGLGEGGGLYIDPAALMSLDAFTQAHVRHNQASGDGNNIYGSYTPLP